MSLSLLTQPTLLLDPIKCRKNIQAMADRAQRHGLHLRPHFKTHLSRTIGGWFREAGVDRITVSSVEMAEYFAPDWNDITIAFPVNVREIAAINRLAATLQLNLMVVSTEVVERLAAELQHPVGIWVKIDVGTHRTGLAPTDSSYLTSLLNSIQSASQLTLKGFLAHTGHTYQAQGSEQILASHAETLSILNGLKTQFEAQGHEIQLSLGDTPACSVAEDFTSIDEIRPGNFVFYDLMQHRIGSNRLDQVAVAFACPVVALHPDRNELVVYGGAVHLSKDRIPRDEDTVTFGQVVAPTDTGWGAPIEGMYVKRLSQEHGLVAFPASQHGKIKVGDMLYILPVHSCLTANLAPYYLTTDGEKIEKWHSWGG